MSNERSYKLRIETSADLAGVTQATAAMGELGGQTAETETELQKLTREIEENKQRIEQWTRRKEEATDGLGETEDAIKDVGGEVKKSTEGTAQLTNAFNSLLNQMGLSVPMANQVGTALRAIGVAAPWIAVATGVAGVVMKLLELKRAAEDTAEEMEREEEYATKLAKVRADAVAEHIEQVKELQKAFADATQAREDLAKAEEAAERRESRRADAADDMQRARIIASGASPEEKQEQLDAINRLAAERKDSEKLDALAAKRKTAVEGVEGAAAEVVQAREAVEARKAAIEELEKLERLLELEKAQAERIAELQAEVDVLMTGTAESSPAYGPIRDRARAERGLPEMEAGSSRRRSQIDEIRGRRGNETADSSRADLPTDEKRLNDARKAMADAERVWNQTRDETADEAATIQAEGTARRAMSRAPAAGRVARENFESIDAPGDTNVDQVANGFGRQASRMESGIENGLTQMSEAMRSVGDAAMAAARTGQDAAKVAAEVKAKIEEIEATARNAIPPPTGGPTP